MHCQINAQFYLLDKIIYSPAKGIFHHHPSTGIQNNEEKMLSKSQKNNIFMGQTEGQEEGINFCRMHSAGMFKQVGWRKPSYK